MITEAFSEDMSVMDDVQALLNEPVTEVAPESAKTEPAKKDVDPELLYIFDAIMTQGTYSEAVQLGKRGGKVTWRTRTSLENDAIMRLVDNQGFQTPVAAGAAFRKATLLFALVNYRGKDMPPISEGLNKRREFINSLPQVVVSFLEDSLATFDNKVASAVREVGPENF